MKTTPTLFSIVVIALVLVSAGAACRSAKSMLPPRHVVNTEREARTLGWPQTIAVAGTGSMEPYIPASSDPSDIVAIAAVECPPYEALNKGDLVVYRSKDRLVIHQIVARQGENWIASGLNNPHYDGPVVNRETFMSRVKKVFILAQALKRPDFYASAAQPSNSTGVSKWRRRGSMGDVQSASRPLQTRLKSRPGARL